MNPNAPWAGRAAQGARAIVRTWLPQPCGKCGKTVTTEDRWNVGHKQDRATHPDLTWDVTNWQPEHRACSDRSGQAAVIAKAKAEERAAVLSRITADGTPPPRPVSLPEGTDQGLVQPALPGIVLPFPTGKPLEARAELAWEPEGLAAWPWLAEFADVPEDASPPLYMSRPPADATGSYGPAAIEWIEKSQRISLRWWQRLAITRQLEHRADGTLCARVVLESAPRRAGKSVRMRGVALWRMEHAELFGEVQNVMHTGSDMAICREIQRQAWRWADLHGWEVTKGNGKECIESTEGDRWLVRAQDAVYGYDVTLGLVDEAWNVKPETVTEGIEPATLERHSPQLHITSTAHRRATSLMRGRISTALAAEDPEVILLLWGAPPGSDPADLEVWRAASPHWSEDRRKLIASKYEAALAGQADPQADDPDPLAGFASQYLNVWRLNERRIDKGEPVTDAETWADLEAERPTSLPKACAIESWFGQGVTVATAWTTGRHVTVAAYDFANLEQGAEFLRTLGWARRRLIVGSSLIDNPALRGFARRPGEKRVAAAVADLADLLREDVLRHDGGDHLTGQILEVRTMPAADGPRLASKGRADAIKAAVWAATAARVAPKRARIIVAS